MLKFLLPLGLMTVTLTPSAMGADAQPDDNIFGCDLRATNITASNAGMQLGMYKLAEKVADCVLLAPDMNSSYGGAEIDGVYYAANMQIGMTFLGPTLLAFDSNTWEPVGLSYNPTKEMMAPGGVALDRSTGLCWGSFYNPSGESKSFGWINYKTGETKVIKEDLDCGKLINAIAHSPEGRLYAILKNGNLIELNKETGEYTVIGSTGLQPNYLASATFDPRSGKMFFALCSRTGAINGIYEVNTTTAQCTLLTNFDGTDPQLCGIYVAVPPEGSVVPAAPTDLKADFEQGSLEGTFTFTAPSTDAQFYPAYGDLDYTVQVDGTTVVTGTTQYGATETVEVSVDAPGNHTFGVFVTNQAGNSATPVITAFIQTSSEIYLNEFSDASAMNSMTILNVNDDYNSWGVKGSEAQLGFNLMLDADDWMITPALSLSAGNGYEVSADFRGLWGNYEEKFEIRVGRQPTVEGMTTVLVAPSTVNNTTYKKFSAVFMPGETGDYYVGVHGISSKDRGGLACDNLAVRNTSSGITDIADDHAEESPVIEAYTVDGRRVTDPDSYRGILILRHADGATTKLLNR